MKVIFPLLFSLILISCQTKYSISTKPIGAVVIANGVELGKTPLIVTTDKITERYGNGVVLDITLPGYQDVKLWMPADGKDYATQINLNPFFKRNQKQFQITESEISREDLNRLIYSLLETQNNLLTKTEPVSDVYLDNLLDANPSLGSAYYLKSLNLFKNNKKEEAVKLLLEAMRYSPNEKEFLELYNELQKQP